MTEIRARAAASAGSLLNRRAMASKLLTRLQRYGPPSLDEEAALVSILTPPKSFAAGQEIIPQYSTPTESTLLLSGLTGRIVSLQTGVQQITAVQVPGDFVDLHAFLLPRMDHSVSALTDCTVTTAPHDALRQVTDTHPRLARGLWYLTVVDASIHRHWLTVLGRREALGSVLNKPVADQGRF